MSKEYMNDGSLTEKWKFRFNFYEKHGFLDSGEQHLNIKQHIKN